MNKAFVREPELDGRGYCPRCGTLGDAVGSGPLDAFIQPASRGPMLDAAWFCGYARCEVAFFNEYEALVTIDQLRCSVYPKDLDAPLCACFGLNYDDVEADVREEVPVRIRELFAKSKSPEARCTVVAANGKCCMAAVQELYMRLKGDPGARASCPGRSS